MEKRIVENKHNRWLNLVLILFFALTLMACDQQARNLRASAVSELYEDMLYTEMESTVAPFASRQYHCTNSPSDNLNQQWTDVFVFGTAADRYTDNVIIKSELDEDIRRVTSFNERFFPQDGYQYDDTYSHCDLILR